MPDRNLHPTVYGIETEYSHLLPTPAGASFEIVGSCHSPDMRLGLYVDPENTGTAFIAPFLWDLATDSIGLVANKEGMLTNGARLYVDPSGLEYCTPEVTTAAGAVERTFDGDEIVLKSLNYLQREGYLGAYQVNRRNTDHNRQSRGIHLNTATILGGNGKEIPTVPNRLATLNIAKGAIFGSGGLLVDKSGKTSFHHSPRLSLTDWLVAKGGESAMRSLVRYPFKTDNFGISRIETITADALNFAWPLRASLVLTDAVVSLLEMGYEDRLPSIPDHLAIDFAKQVGQYGNEKRVSVDGDHDGHDVIFPLEIIQRICQQILVADETEDFLTQEAKQVIPEIIEVADKLVEDPNTVATQVESVARAVAIDRKIAKHGCSIDSERVCRFDYAWDKLGGGIAETLRSKGFGWQGFAPGSIRRTDKQRLISPQDTRAKVRADFIMMTGGTDRSSWGWVANAQGHMIRLHPHEFVAPESVAKLLDEPTP